MKKRFRKIIAVLLALAMTSTAIPLSVSAMETVGEPGEVYDESYDGVLGDADVDDIVNIQDVTAIQRYLAEQKMELFNLNASDVNRDGTVTVNDATGVQYFLAEFSSQPKGIGELVGVIDSDEDGLSDEKEKSIGTDPLKPDTDGDGLTDFQEVVLGTDPLIPNTYSDTLDSDSDGLTDLAEVSDYFTDPLSADTDGDELNDYEEINTYRTNPLLADSDGDLLSDKFEIDHGLDPNNVCSDGVTPDAERTFEQSVSEECISSQVAAEDNVALPAISGEAKGDISDNVFVSESRDELVGGNRSVIGKAINVSVEEEDYDVSSLSLSFDISKYRALGGDAEALAICKVNEDGTFEVVDTDVLDNTVSCRMDSEGTYCVIDIDDFLSRLGININDLSDGKSVSPVATAKASGVSTADSISGQADIVFAIDTTGSMSEEIAGVERNVKYFAQKLKSDYNVMANYALIDFKDLEEDGYDTTKVLKSGSSNWFSNDESFANKVDSMNAIGGGDDPECDVDALETARRLDFRPGSHKFVVLITDAEYKVLNRYGIESMEEEADLLSRSGIVTSVVTSSYLKSVYQVLLDKTNGIYADINSNFGDVLLQLADMIGASTSSDKWVIMKHGYSYIELPEESDGDYDDDGLTDEYELGEKEIIDLSSIIALRLALGGVTFDKYIGKTTIEVYNSRSNPLKSDTDNDGLIDSSDDAPWTKGLKNGIVGGLRICSYSKGPSSFGRALFDAGHAYVAYTSFVNDDLSLYGTLVSSPDEVAKEDDTRTSAQSYHGVHMGVNEVITIGGWAGWLPDSLKGTWINNEYYLFDGYGPSNQYSLSAYITDSQLQKFSSITRKNSKWDVINNCSAYAANFWNEVTGDDLSAQGILIYPNPSSLSNNIRKRAGYIVDGKMGVAMPKSSGSGGGGGGGGSW